MYQPECYRLPEEHLALARVVGRRGGILCTHIRGEGDSLVDSVREVIELARQAEVRLNISHFKSTGIRNWNREIHRAIDCIEDARAMGQDVSADFYPYDGGSTTIASLLPPTCLDRPFTEFATPAGKALLRTELQKSHPGWDNMAESIGWDRILISSLAAEQFLPLQGQSIAEAARQLGYDEPADLVCELLAAENGKVGIIVLSMSPQDVDLVATLPYTSLISDALYGGGGAPHPRLYGAFPKFLREVRERNLMPMEAAIHKMTGMPAEKLRLRDRGLLLPGYRADLLLFRPELFRDHAVYGDSRRLSTGMGQILIGGKTVWQNERMYGQPQGRLLQSS